jgi:hypothetical protein
MSDSKFWAYSLSPGDINQQLNEACKAYAEKHGRRPFLAFIPQDLKPFPISGLQMEPNPLIPRMAVYFALHGSLDHV